jgi:hypothetical protein
MPSGCFSQDYIFSNGWVTVVGNCDFFLYTQFARTNIGSIDNDVERCFDEILSN